MAHPRKESACSTGNKRGGFDLDYPLEKEMATHSNILAWRIPWTGAWRATVHGVAKSQRNTAEHACTTLK